MSDEFPVPSKWLVIEVSYGEKRAHFCAEMEDYSPSFFTSREAAIDEAHRRCGEAEPDKLYLVMKADTLIRPLPRTFQDIQVSA